ncbi:type II toxin-antitoxin system RelE/ParE family toxin [Nitrospira sp. M1]
MNIYSNSMRGMWRLGNNPLGGKSQDKVRKGYRSIHINRHVIYYRLIGETIDIVRMLHERMIPETHL